MTTPKHVDAHQTGPTAGGWFATAISDQLGAAQLGRQHQTFVCAGSHAGITPRWIVMPPGWTAVMHEHHDTAISVSLISGFATSIMVSPAGDLVAEHHAPGDVIIIDRGVLHVAINRSRTEPVVASEVGATGHFNHDVVRHPAWDSEVQRLGEELRGRFEPDTQLRYTVVDVLLSRRIRTGDDT